MVLKKKFIFDTNTIVVNALIAALYVVMNAISAPIAFGAIQFRIAEMLMLFVFFNKISLVKTLILFLLNFLFSSSITNPTSLSFLIEWLVHEPFLT